MVSGGVGCWMAAAGPVGVDELTAGRVRLDTLARIVLEIPEILRSKRALDTPRLRNQQQYDGAEAGQSPLSHLSVTSTVTSQSPLVKTIEIRVARHGDKNS